MSSRRPAVLASGRRAVRGVRVLATLGVLAVGLAGCSGSPHPVAAPAGVPVASAEAVRNPVPAMSTTKPAPAPPTPRRTGPAPRPTRTTTDTPGAGSGDAGLDRFVAAVQEQLPAVALDRRDEEVEELGQQACSELAAGQKPATVAAEISDQGVTSADAQKLVALAHETACR
ncbi:DUF732 domain-containing protein [Actinoplanes sp. CA-030573]|uniref:DUF732 domain-containing protein n=1 Tax=Actinoplanes sp. CA-030573 TaxID=3239898 RepID=UPI003D949205